MGKSKKKSRKQDSEQEEDMDQRTHLKVDENIEELKQEKIKAKSAFTKSHNCLKNLMDDDMPSRREIRASLETVCTKQEKLVDALMELYKSYKMVGNHEKMKQITKEMEKIKSDLDESKEAVEGYLESRKDDALSVTTNASIKSWQMQNEREQKEQVILGLERELELEEMEYNEMKTKAERKLQLKRQSILDAKQDAEQDQEEDEPRANLTPQIERCVEKDKNIYSSHREIGQDMWKQMKRVSIPVFAGNKRNYENWKAAFSACIDKAPATPEYKLLQLRQHLSGEALKVIENLGHSAPAYEAAKSRLERKFGGQRRQMARYLQELDEFKPIREGQCKDVEEFADILDVAIINFKEAGRTEELGHGSLYIKLQQKMTESMVAQFHRWVHEHQKQEGVEALHEWAIQEAEFQTLASDTLHGLASGGSYKKKGIHQTYFGKNSKGNSNVVGITKSDQSSRGVVCPVCNHNHPIWRCQSFKDMGIDQRWQRAKLFKLCYRCLGGGHLGQTCTRTRICGIDGCRDTHNRLLHGGSAENNNDRGWKTNVAQKEYGAESTKSGMEEEKTRSDDSYEKTAAKHHVAMTTSTRGKTVIESDNHIPLRTVAVVLKHGKKQMVVNALLDDGSTKTYLNSDVAAELGLQGETRQVTVSVLNNQSDTFETMPVEFGLESLDGRVDTKISAFTANKITGNLRVVNWQRQKDKWSHLKDIKFPRVGPKPIIDILIGIDYADLHFSCQDIRGGAGEPVARLTPLGWTCIGNPECDSRTYQSRLVHTYFIKPVQKSSQEDTNEMLRRFWEIEKVPNKEECQMSMEEKTAMKLLEESLVYKEGRYKVCLPWKDTPTKLPSNHQMALNRLKNTEKRLMKDPAIASSYSEVIHQYKEKGYIRKIGDANEQETGWYLPHFPVIRKDKATTKTRIVFDASAKQNDIALNDIIHQGPKLQQDLFEVLLRFRRHPIAVVCDIAEMYLQISIAEEDRRYLRFLWRDLNLQATREICEFNRVVFGVNFSPFAAQYVAQENARRNAAQFSLAAETILKSTYMDDSIDSVPDEEVAVQLHQELSTVWSKAGMHARKWLSNSNFVMKNIPIEDRAQEVDLDKSDLPSTKTLGMLWDAKEDIFTYRYNATMDYTKLTKKCS